MIKTGVFFVALAMAGAASAAPFSATLQTPVAKSAEVATDDVLWKCKDAQCVVTSDLPSGRDLGLCRDLARQVGAVTAFGAAPKLLDAAQLADCNRVAKR